MDDGELEIEVKTIVGGGSEFVFCIVALYVEVNLLSVVLCV